MPRLILTKLILLSVLAVMPAQALQLEFIGPCSDAPIFSHEVADNYKNVGELTVGILNQKNISYQGSEQGIQSAFGTPTGLDAMEVISDNEMRAYGWCYNVDGSYPDIFANEIEISKEMNKIQWIYGFAHYLNGEWISQCEASYKVKPNFLCGTSKDF